METVDFPGFRRSEGVAACGCLEGVSRMNAEWLWKHGEFPHSSSSHPRVAPRFRAHLLTWERIGGQPGVYSRTPRGVLEESTGHNSHHPRSDLEDERTCGNCGQPVVHPCGSSPVHEPVHNSRIPRGFHRLSSRTPRGIPNPENNKPPRQRTWGPVSCGSARTLLDSGCEFLHLVVHPAPLGHLLAHLLLGVHDRGVVAAERLPDLGER